jgi:hypothetical protein
MPRGVRKVETQTVTGPLPDRKQFTEALHYDEILGIRCLKKGQFRGLWELVRLDDQGKVRQVLTDANSKNFIITMASRAIYKIVATM